MKHYDRVECKDGFSMSVQAGLHLYSTPRERASRYTAVEVGFPSEREPLLMEYAEDPGEPTETVYPYVPVGVVAKVIKKHGGMVGGEAPPGVRANLRLVHSSRGTTESRELDSDFLDARRLLVATRGD